MGNYFFDALQGELSMFQAEGVDKLLVLDFDDVINFFPRQIDINQLGDLEKLHPQRHNFKYRTGDFEKYKVNVDDAVIGIFNELLADPTVQLLWLTTWNEHVLAVQERMGLRAKRPPQVLHCVYEADGQDHSKLKAEGLSKFMATGDFTKPLRVAWVDDKLTEYLDRPQNHARRASVFGPLKTSDYLVACPPEEVGLVAQDAEALSTFLRSGVKTLPTHIL